MSSFSLLWSSYIPFLIYPCRVSFMNQDRIYYHDSVEIINALQEVLHQSLLLLSSNHSYACAGFSSGQNFFFVHPILPPLPAGGS